MSPNDVTPCLAPLAELHCHLNGSVRLQTLAELGEEQGHTFSERIAALAVAGPSVANLRDYLRCNDIAIRLLQTPHALHRAARELVEDWAADGIVHGEMRIAPQLHTAGGLSLRQVVDAVVSGLKAGEAAGCTARLILACLRQGSPQLSLATARLAASAGDPVVGFDIAGDETLPLTPHLPAFEAAHSLGLHITAHAGEAAGPDSVREVLDRLGPERIGHGVAAATDTGLISRLAHHEVALEMCPTSNHQTRAVTPGSPHPAAALLAQGVAVTINTDNRTVSATTLTKEYARLTNELRLSPVQLAQLRANAWAHRFR